MKTKHDGWVFPGGQVEAGENLIGVYSNTGTCKWHDGVTDGPAKLMLDLIAAPAIRIRYQACVDADVRINSMEYVTKPEFELKLARRHRKEELNMTSSNEPGQLTDLPDKLAKPARRALIAAGYVRLEQLATARESELLKLHGMGPKAMDQLRQALADKGLSFADGE
ncbi:hypothetical protein [Paenibacillus thiaminolyticus]|uniref:hypothetical protein n=1 Tax=Paenibacillus thiaminolyticus TaxID=49283 RepID=UPI0032B2385B